MNWPEYLSLAVLFGGATLVVLAWRDGRRHYSTDAGERRADRDLAAAWPDDKDLDPEDCR